MAQYAYLHTLGDESRINSREVDCVDALKKRMIAELEEVKRVNIAGEVKVWTGNNVHILETIYMDDDEFSIFNVPHSAMNANMLNCAERLIRKVLWEYRERGEDYRGKGKKALGYKYGGTYDYNCIKIESSENFDYNLLIAGDGVTERLIAIVNWSEMDKYMPYWKKQMEYHRRLNSRSYEEKHDELCRELGKCNIQKGEYRL